MNNGYSVHAISNYLVTPSPPPDSRQCTDDEILEQPGVWKTLWLLCKLTNISCATKSQIRDPTPACINNTMEDYVYDSITPLPHCSYWYPPLQHTDLLHQMFRCMPTNYHHSFNNCTITLHHYLWIHQYHLQRQGNTSFDTSESGTT